MMGLILKDIFSMRKYFLKQMLYMLVLYLLLSVAVLHSISYISCMMIMSVMMMLISSFSVDENAKWDAYALTMPLTPRTLVGAKYLLFYGALLISGVSLSLICGIVDAVTFREGFTTIAASSGSIMAIYGLSATLFLPFVYKLGAEKARLVMSICFVLPFIAVIWAASYFGIGSQADLDLTSFLQTLPWPLIAAAGVVVLALLVLISFFLSVKFYEQKEF